MKEVWQSNFQVTFQRITRKRHFASGQHQIPYLRTYTCYKCWVKPASQLTWPGSDHLPSLIMQCTLVIELAAMHMTAVGHAIKASTEWWHGFMGRVRWLSDWNSALERVSASSMPAGGNIFPSLSAYPLNGDLWIKLSNSSPWACGLRSLNRTNQIKSNQSKIQI